MTLRPTRDDTGDDMGAQATPDGERRTARLTVAELARAAGVNKSTVSRALRGDSSINRETRLRIQQLADEMQYEPNASARRLFHARTDVLAFTSHAFSRPADSPDPFLGELLSATVTEAGERNLDVLLCRPEFGDKELSVYQRVVGGSHADGFILMDLRPDDLRLPYLCGKRFPHVLFGRPSEDLDESRRYPFPWVEVDNRAGARAGAEHLIALGHSRIGFLGYHDTYICHRDRLTGFRDGLVAAGIPMDPALRIEGGVTQEDGYRLTRQLLALDRPPTAIFAASDVLAVGAIHAARDAGLHVGREFPILGFDGLAIGASCTPQLTTLRQPIHTVGRLLVQLLADAVEGPQAAGEEGRAIHHLLQPELVIRESTVGG